MGLRLITPPAYQPITLAQALAHLRVDSGDDDAYVTLVIASACSAIEGFTKRALYKQKWRLTLNGFPFGGRMRYDMPPNRIHDLPVWADPSAIELPIGPLVSTSPISSVSYVDDNGTTQVLSTASYRVSSSDMCVLAPTWGEVWPSTLPVQDAVTIDFWAGYAEDTAGGDTANAIPPALKQAMLLMIGQFYENREATISGTIVAELPLGVQSLCAPFASVRF